MSSQNSRIASKLKNFPLFLEQSPLNLVVIFTPSPMNRSILSALTLAIAASGLVSCSSMKSAMNKVANPVKSLAKLNTNDLKNFKLRDLKNNAPPVVEVRKKDLKKMKTAEENILAWNRLKRSQQLKYGTVNANGEIFMPQDFDPSDLPVDGQIPTFGILPSLKPGGNSAANIGDNDDLLPPDVANLPDIPLSVPSLPEEKKTDE